MEADIDASHLVLDVAIGNGYSTALLAQLADMVVGVERDEESVARVEETLASLGIVNSAVVSGDPAMGVKKQGPFDRIFISMAVETVSKGLLLQLKEGGKLAAIILDAGMARGVIYTRTGDVFCERIAFDASARIGAEGFEKVEEFSF